MRRKGPGRPAHDDVLTPAEWRTVDGVRHGLTNKEIARRRGISVDGVKFHVANAIAKLGVANRRELRRWPGAPKDSELARREANMTSGARIDGLGQVARTVSDTPASARWYREVLGLEHLYTYGTLAFFDCGGTRLMLSQHDGALPAESILYFRVADVRAAVERLEERGAEVTHAPHMIHRHADGTEEWMAFVNDPDGRPIGIMTAVSP